MRLKRRRYIMPGQGWRVFDVYSLPKKERRKVFRMFRNGTASPVRKPELDLLARCFAGGQVGQYMGFRFIEGEK